MARTELQRRMASFHEACKRAGVKMTHQRIVIFRTLAQSTEHPDVETVYNAVRKRLPTVSLDTVYRTLWLFRDLGLVQTLGAPRERVRFDANTERHHHFVCARCGVTRDFTSNDLDDLPIPDEVRAMGCVTLTHVELRGLCVRCLAEDERSVGSSRPATNKETHT